MIEGEEFKSFAELLKPDGSSTSFVVSDPSHPDGVRSKTLADEYRSAEALALDPSVPQSIRGYFDGARMLWVFGWFYYPFYTWATLHATICAEMGLKERFAVEGIEFKDRKGRKFQPTFAYLLDRAVDCDWLTADQFTRTRERHTRMREWNEMLAGIGVASVPEPPETPERLMQLVRGQVHNFREIRNMHAHATAFFYMPSGSGYVSLEFARDLLNQLFRAKVLPEQGARPNDDGPCAAG